MNLLLPIFVLTITAILAQQQPMETSFVCPSNLPCDCQAQSQREFEINCIENTTSSSAFNIIIQPEDLVVIQCQDSPDWQNIFRGESINVGPIRKFVFSSCAPQIGGTEVLVNRMNVSDVEVLKFANLKGELRMEDLSAFPDTKQLVLSDNKLGAVKPDLLKGLPYLKQLELRNSKIEIPNGFFDAASSLKILELGNNNLQSLNPGIFDGLKRIQLLNLWQNNFTTFQPDVFRNLSSLVGLDIHQCNLHTLPDNLFRDLANLEIINFGANNFTSLPEGIFRTTPKLQVVRFQYNRGHLMEGLPPRMLADLPDLKIVSLMHSRIFSLPEDTFWGSINLSELNLNMNYLSTLPARLFKDATDLTVLTISFNDLKELPDGMLAHAKNLVKLDLSKNHLTAINERTLMGLESLKELNMENNDLEFIDLNAFSSLGALKIGKFANNKLTLQTSMVDDFGPISPFHLCGSLEQLYLSHNNISSMFSDWVVSNLNLRKLDLTYNHIDLLDTEDLQFISNSIDVDLRHNNITRIGLAHLAAVANESTSFDTHQITIHLSDNPYNCDCGIFWLSRYLNRDMEPQALDYVHLDLEGAMCAEPANMRNVSVMELKSSTLTCKIEKSLPNDYCGKDGICECWLRPHDNTILMNCAGKNLTKVPEWIDGRGTACVELDLQGNEIEVAPNMEAPGYDKVCSLNLARNRIREINESLISPKLKVLNLEHNNITSISTDVLDKISIGSLITKLTLDNNPWHCDCNARDLLLFIQSNFLEIPDLVNVTCILTNNTIVSLSTLSIDDICPFNYMLVIIVFSVVSVLTLLIGILIALYYRYQKQIKIWLYSKNLCLCLVTEDELDREKTYDAFVSYSHQDQEFVFKELVTKLENGSSPYKLCIHTRDWAPGEWIASQIEHSVEQSRRTIVVVSPDFLKSMWGQLEFKIAHKRALNEKRNRVIVIIYGNIGPIETLNEDLRTYLQTNTYIRWGDPWFWQKLRYAMPHSMSGRMMRQNISMANEQQVEGISITMLKDGNDVKKVEVILEKQPANKDYLIV